MHKQRVCSSASIIGGTKQKKNNMLKLSWIVSMAAFALGFALASGQAMAQDKWPSKPIRFVVPWPPGGASDVTARILGQKLQQALGQPVVVENHPGGNGIIALELVAKSPADGYTILMANSGPNAINPVLYEKLPYDAIKDFAPITLTTMVPLILTVNPAVDVRSVKELLTYAKAHPGKLNMASPGQTTVGGMAVDLLKYMTGIDVLHVIYKGDSPAITALLAGQVQVMLPTVIAITAHIKSGRLRALAVASAKRLSSMPDLPTMDEAGVPGFEADSWGGVMVPAGTPPAVVQRLHTEIVRILKMPDVAERLHSLGAEIIGSTPEEFAAYLKSEIDKWGKVARSTNSKLVY
jgi:tripartite-type tricarboxylate transporter receptor subunit TctC